LTTAYDRTEIMMQASPEYYSLSRVYRGIIGAYATDVTLRSDDQDDLINQLYVQTATWGLVYWEAEYNVTPDVGDDYETRRARVLAKMQGLGTFTKYEARMLANAYSRAKTAQYRNIPGEDAFTTIHEVDDLIDLAGLVSAFEEMKPAHMEHVIGLLIKVLFAPNFTTAANFAQQLRDSYLMFSGKVHIQASGETPVFGKYQAPFVNGVVNKPPTLFWNGAWDTNGYYKMDGDNFDGVHLYNRQADTLTIVKRDKGTGAVLETWTEVDRPK
jgi:hypothetical protein